MINKRVHDAFYKVYPSILTIILGVTRALYSTCFPDDEKRFHLTKGLYIRLNFDLKNSRLTFTRSRRLKFEDS
jgi:hypothetical protein